MSTTQMPATEEIGTFLTSLLGLSTSAKEGAALEADAIHAVGDFRDDAGEVKAVLACDIAAAAKLAAALTRIPAGGVEDAISEGELSGNLSDNLKEVFNIVVNIFPEAHSHRLASNQVTIGADAAAAFASSAADFDAVTYDLDIQQYGAGRICIGTQS